MVLEHFKENLHTSICAVTTNTGLSKHSIKKNGYHLYKMNKAQHDGWASSKFYAMVG